MSNKKGSGINFMPFLLGAITLGKELWVKVILPAIEQLAKWCWQAMNWMHNEYVRLRTEALGGVRPSVIERVGVALGIAVVVIVLVWFVLFF